MSNLLYSTANINHNELNLLPIPEALGNRHHPYGFGKYVTDIKDAVDMQGLVVVNEEFEVSPNGNQLFGALEVAIQEGELITAKDWKLLIGLRGSHDQSIQRGLSLGSQVMVCSNLCFSGSIGSINTKQTTNIESRIPILLKHSLELVPELAHNQEAQYDKYKQFELNPRHGDAALIELFRRGAFSGAQLTRAVHEWDTPTYIEHTQFDAGTDTRSLWRLFNACTQSLKPTGNVNNSVLVAQRSKTISQFMDEIVKVAA